ncbi:SusC/RagA family TonB-linked outer membrane protein [Zunongwangia mangrovi]|nr:SusC/RagA family TonB-linked outer membrane protein [Zunongwangia mangrovi]
MKLTVFLLLVSIFSSNANSYSQKSKISIDLEEVSVGEVLKEIENLTDYKFLFDSNEIDIAKIVSVKGTKRPVKNILEEIFQSENLEIRLLKKQIILKKNSDNTQTPVEVIKTSRSNIYQKTISGVVISKEDSLPLAGVNVMVKGTNKGVITDFEGAYTLEASIGSTLVFSYLGFRNQEIIVEDEGSIDVSMVVDQESLADVVVVGYGTKRREEISASIASVKSEDFVQTSTPDATQLLRGKVAGLNIITPDANPQATSQISLRGVATLNSGRSPLVLIDGVPGSMNTVSPNDIAQIDVLKDGSAAAIYGTRGTNGVILITTKSGQGVMEPTIEMNSYVSTQQIIKKLPVMTAAEYRERADAGQPGAIDRGFNTDWVDEILQTPFNQTYSLSIKGGSNKTNYIATVDYTSNEGIVKRSRINVVYPRLYVSHKMFDDKLKIDASINGFKRSFGIPYNDAVYQNAVIYNPTAPIKDDDGNWTESAREMYENPLALLYETEGENKISNFRMYSALSFKPIEDLTFKVLGSQETTNQFSGYYETMQHRSTTIQGRNGYATRNTSRTQNDMLEVTAEYRKLFSDKHSINALGGYTWIRNNYQTAGMVNWDFPSDDYSYNNIGLGEALQLGSAGQSTYQAADKLVGYFGRLNYNFDGKYYLSGSLRYEGSSKFGENHKWGVFPGISAAWNMDNESFLRKFEDLSYLKLRGGFGVTGTVPTDPYQSLITLNLGGFGYYNGEWVNLLRAGSNPNPDLRWEKKEEINIGVDFGFFEERLTGSLDVYRRDTKDLIWNYSVPVPPYLYPTIAANAGTLRSDGIEISLGIVPITNENFNWSTNFNFSTNRSILRSLSNDEFISNGFSDLGNTLAPIQQTTHRIQEGERIGNFFGYNSIDIDEEGHWIIEGQDGTPKPIIEQSPNDKKVIGNGLPKYYINWNHSFAYKRFDMSVTMRGAFDYQILNMANMNYGVPGALTDNNIFRTAFEDVYSKRPLANDQSPQYVSYFVEDGDYWKFDNVTIGFRPKLETIQWIDNLRIYGSVNNLAVITGYSGIDPEVNVQGLTPGLDDRYRYPSARTFTLGVNLTLKN